MERVLQFVITPSQAGRPLKSLLKEKGLSQTLTRRVKRWPGGITVDGKPVHTDFRPSAGDVVAVLIEREREEASAIPPLAGTVDIRYEDGDLLVLHKDAGLATHPSAGHRIDSLAARVAAYFGGKGEARPFRPVGRLDCDTSGLCLVAKNSFCQHALEKQRPAGAFGRTYYAVCHGAVEPAAGTLSAPILSAPGRLKRLADPAGQPAITRYRRLFTGGGLSLLRVEIDTGRTHQIRVHLSHLGYPLAGDFLYGTEDPGLIARHALHSGRLFLIHPLTGEAMAFLDPLPKDMAALCGKMGLSQTLLPEDERFLLQKKEPV